MPRTESGPQPTITTEHRRPREINYRIREIDGGDNADILTELHSQCFGSEAPQADYDIGHWWLAYYEKEPIGFAGLTPSQFTSYCGYLKRAGVLPEHRGHGLQRRLVRVRESRARKNGWSRIVTDCTDNPASANNLFKAGYRMFTPKAPWFRESTLYWIKSIERN